MSTSLVFSSSSFFVEGVEVLNATSIRVRYSSDALRVDPTGAHDALNPTNYVLTGPHVATPFAVDLVSGDPQAVTVHLNVPLVSGSWSLLVSNVQLPDSTPLTSASITFFVDALTTAQVVNGGAQNDVAENIIRKHLPVSMAGKAWNALIGALSVGDKYNWDNAVLAFNQLFVSSASGLYLDRKANDSGVVRPIDMGMSDKLFRKYAVKTAAEKLTSKSILDILEIFYGPESVRAFIETEVSEPFALKDGDTLEISDGVNSYPVKFFAANFNVISRATAIEVASLITEQCRYAGIVAFATPILDPATNTNKVRVFTKAQGLAARIGVLGGTAQNALLFPARNVDANVFAGAFLRVDVPSNGIGRYYLDSDQEILFVNEGDYVNISNSLLNPANNGSFKIVATNIVWDGAEYVQSFDVLNNDAVIQIGPLAVNGPDDVVFFKPLIQTSNADLVRSAILAQSGRGVDITIPATTQAVGRQEYEASYLNPPKVVAVTHLFATPDSEARVTTATPHGLSVGDTITVEGVASAMETPVVVSGTPGTAGTTGLSDVCQGTHFGTVRNDSEFAACAHHQAVTLSSGDVLFASGGTDNPVAFSSACSRFRIVNTAPMVSGSGIGRLQYAYNWVATASTPAPCVNHRLVAFQQILAGKALMTGGKNVTGVISQSALYDEVANTWTSVTGLLARQSHATCVTLDASGNEVCFISGGLNNSNVALTKIQTFSGTNIVDFDDEATGRAFHQMVSLGTNGFLSIGGSTTAGVARADCLAYDTVLGQYRTVGNLNVARHDFGVFSDTSRVIVAGGVGRNPTNETSDRLVGECEILDFATMSWRMLGKMRFPRKNCHIIVENNRVYVLGGCDLAGAAIPTVEFYDLDIGKWFIAPSTAVASTPAFDAVSVVDGVLIKHGGQSVGGVASPEARLFVPGADFLSVAVNGQQRVDGVTSANDFSFGILDTEFMASTTGLIMQNKANAGVFAGPFILDPHEGFAVTAVESTLTQSLNKNRQYQTLSVVNATAFPDEAGYLAIGFGYEDVIGPIRYFGRISNTELSIDFTTKMPANMPVGRFVTLLAQKGPFNPADASDLGAFYLTASSSGRVAAEAAVRESLSSGAPVNVTVTYPNDVGLGNAGRPAAGIKPSDKIAVWGGNNLDAEIAAAVKG